MRNNLLVLLVLLIMLLKAEYVSPLYTNKEYVNSGIVLYAISKPLVNVEKSFSIDFRNKEQVIQLQNMGIVQKASNFKLTNDGMYISSGGWTSMWIDLNNLNIEGKAIVVKIQMWNVGNTWDYDILHRIYINGVYIQNKMTPDGCCSSFITGGKNRFPTTKEAEYIYVITKKDLLVFASRYEYFKYVPSFTKFSKYDKLKVNRLIIYHKGSGVIRYVSVEAVDIDSALDYLKHYWDKMTKVLPGYKIVYDSSKDKVCLNGNCDISPPTFSIKDPFDKTQEYFGGYKKIKSSDTIDMYPNLPPSDYIITFDTIIGDSPDELDTKHSQKPYDDSIITRINGKIVLWYPTGFNDRIPSLKIPLFINYGAKWREYIKRCFIYYKGSINHIELQGTFDESNDNEWFAFSHVKITKVKLTKVSEYDPQNSNMFKTIDEKGNIVTKVTYISDTKEYAIGGNSGFGHGARIELDNINLPTGLYLIKFNFYFIDTWDGAPRRYLLGDSGALYVNDLSPDNLIWRQTTMYLESGRVPVNELSPKYWKVINFPGSQEKNKDLVGTFYVVYYGNINKLIWTTYLDQNGNDESFALGKVEIYKINTYTYRGTANYITPISLNRMKIEIRPE